MSAGGVILAPPAGSLWSLFQVGCFGERQCSCLSLKGSDLEVNDYPAKARRLDLQKGRFSNCVFVWSCRLVDFWNLTRLRPRPVPVESLHVGRFTGSGHPALPSLHQSRLMPRLISQGAPWAPREVRIFWKCVKWRSPRGVQMGLWDSAHFTIYISFAYIATN